MKTCSRCRGTKPLTAFGKNSNAKDGLFAYCKPCASAAASQWRKNNPEKHNATRERWYSENKETIADKRRTRRQGNYEEQRQKERQRELRQRYNLSLEDYELMVLQQEGKCAICEKLILDTPRIDHDHACCPGYSCGRCVRGLLCGPCNSHLGWYEANKDATARYLKEQVHEDSEH